MSVLIATPGRSVKPGWREAASRASGIPSRESWSVRAMIWTPRETASSTRRVGVRRPSEKLLCRCRSARLLTAFNLPVDPHDAAGQPCGLVYVDQDGVEV